MREGCILPAIAPDHQVTGFVFLNPAGCQECVTLRGSLLNKKMLP